MGELLPFPTQLKKSDQKKIDSNNKLIQNIALDLNFYVTNPYYKLTPDTDKDLLICSDRRYPKIQKGISELEYNTIQDDLANFSLERELYTITVQQNFLVYSEWKKMYGDSDYHAQIVIKITGNINNIVYDQLEADKDKVENMLKNLSSKSLKKIA